MITSFCVNLVAMLVLWGFKVMVSKAQRSDPSPLPAPLDARKPQKAVFEEGVGRELDKI